MFRLFLYGLLGLFITSVLITQVIVRYFIWPQLEIRKDQIESVVSKELGINAKIGAIHANWESFRPSFEITDINFKKDPQLDDSLKNKVLNIPKLSGIVSWSSIWSGMPRFYYLKSEGISLTAQRDINGLWNFAGFPMSNTGSDTKVMEWILHERNLSTNLLQVTVFDDFEGNSVNNFTIENFSLKNQGQHHEVELNAYVKPTQGILNFKGDFNHLPFSNSSDWRNWTGAFKTDISKINAANLLKITKLPIKSGSGQVEFDAQIALNKGVVEKGHATLNANQINIIWANKQPDLHLNKLQLTLDQSAKKNAQLIDVENFNWQFQDNSQQIHEISGMKIQISPNAAKDSINEINIIAPRIPLTDVSKLVQSVPLPAKVFKVLHQMQPKGLVEEFNFDWNKNTPEHSFLNKPKHVNEFAISAKFKNLGWEKYDEHIPGLENFSGKINANLNEGSIIIDSPNLSIQSEYYFEKNKVNLPPLTGTIHWKNNASQWHINFENLMLKDSHSELQASGSYLTGKSPNEDMLDLNLQVSQFKAVNLLELIPKIIAPTTFHYLRSNISGGIVENSSVIIHGPTKEIPYAKSSSNKFSVNVNFRDGVFRPVEPNKKSKGEWPFLEKIQAKIELDKNLLKVEASTGKYKNVTIKDVVADMDIAARPNTLNVKGNAAGSLGDFLQYLVTTPIAYKFQPELKKMSFSGNADVNLDLHHQFGDREHTELNAKIGLSKNQIKWGNNPPGIISIGTLVVDQTGIRKADITGNFMGGPLLIKTNPNNEDQLDILGDLDIAMLTELFTLSEDLSIDPNQKLLSGKLGVQGSLNKKKNENALSLNLDLKQTSINFPGPFFKPTGDPLNGNLKLSLLNGDTPSIDWQVKLGNFIQSVGHISQNNLTRASVAIGNTKLPNETNGIQLLFDVAQIDVDQWLKLKDDFDKRNPNYAERFQNKSSNSAESIPIKVVGKASKVTLLGNEIADVNVDANESQGNWSANIKAKDILGKVEWQKKNSELPYGAIKGYFSELKIPQSSPSSSSNYGKNTPKSSIKSLPSIDLKIDNFSYGKMQLSELYLQGDGSPLEWQLNQFKAINKYGELLLKGSWELPSGNDIGKTALNFDLQTNDTGEFLSTMDIAEKVISKGKTSLKGNIHWQGSPIDFNTISLNGDIQLEIKNGSILQVDPGAAKLLGILSLQSLFKFATLNFGGSLGESLKSGTPFDEITATGNIRRGNIRSNDFEMKSTLAKITSRGIINLNRETQDLRVTIYPRINLGSASLAAFYFVTPILGITTMIGQYLFSSGINKALQTDLLVQGDWKNPEVIPLDQSGKPLDQETLQNIRRKSLLNEPPKNPKDKSSPTISSPANP